MTIKVGDRVRFLNEVGGGTVTKYQNKNVVLVLQDDGFEVPVLARECVVIESAQEQTPASTQKEKQPQVAAEVYEYEETPEGDKLNLVFAIVPQDAKNIPGNGLDIYLINDSNYFVSYVVTEEDKNKCFPVSNGIVEPNTKILLGGYSITDLDDVKNFNVQALAYKTDKSYDLQKPLLKPIPVNAVKLSKANNYARNEYFHEPAVVVPVVVDELEEKVKQLTKQQTDQVIKEKEKRPRVKQSQKVNPQNNIVEVDLHIHELLDSTSGMSNGEMLEYQMDAFRKTLDQYKNKKGQKIVFIHGVGNGTLKTDLRKEIERKYKYPFQDASFREYGFGATMVIIK